jgi:putative heme transporter
VDADTADTVPVNGLEPGQLRASALPPSWLRGVGRSAWLLVGVIALLVAVTWVLGIASTIIGPLLVSVVVGAVTSPVVDWLHRKRIPRALGALVVLLALVALGIVIVLLVVRGVTSESANIAAQADAALAKLHSWLKDLGLGQSASSETTSSLQHAVPTLIKTFTHGLAQGIRGLTSVVFFFSFSAFCSFFMLKDAPAIRAWFERSLRVPLPVASLVTKQTGSSLRGYFVGTSIVAGFNAFVVGIGALVLSVPLAGTIAVVTFVLAFIPFIGAVIAGAFAVILALGANGTTTALIMLVIVILANGALQNIVQPFAMGAALNLSPLVILVVTIAAGSFFGTAGMILAAPLTAAGVRISAGISGMRATSDGAQERPVRAENPLPS